MTQLRLLSTPDTLDTEARIPVAKPGIRAPRARRGRTRRPLAPTPVRLDARTRELGRSGVAEARRRLAEINAAEEHTGTLVRAS